MYPNPTTNYLIFSGVKGQATAEIANLSGQVVVKHQFNKESRLEIDLPSGIYLVTVSDQDSQIHMKIVVQ